MKIEKSAKMEKEIQRLREKITEMQGQLREKEQQKTELENLEIVGMVRGLDVRPGELADFIAAFRAQKSGGLPPSPQVMENAAEWFPPEPVPEPVDTEDAADHNDDYGSGFLGTGQTSGGYSFDEAGV